MSRVLGPDIGVVSGFEASLLHTQASLSFSLSTTHEVKASFRSGDVTNEEQTGQPINSEWNFIHTYFLPIYVYQRVRTIYRHMYMWYR